MSILQSHQYNQSIGKYKLLSSTAGVGSIITTKFGTYVLVLDINKWPFVQTLNNRINNLLENPPKDIYETIKRETKNLGLTLVDDNRFVQFIQKENELDKLKCLIAIPQMPLHERFNSVQWTKKIHGRKEPSHPISMALMEANGNTGNSSDYQIQGTHFPKWFLSAKKENGKNKLKTIHKWREIWRNNGNSISSFAPPRDANTPIKDSDGKPKRVTYTDSDNVQRNISLHRELSQINLVLICKNGHLSDIPWSQFLNWKTQKLNGQIDRNDMGSNLFNLDPCCGNPDLRWSESSTKSEGYGSVYIECASCGLGNGYDGNPKITLEGINSLNPNCPGHKPWEIDIQNPNVIPYETCHKNGNINSHESEQMQVSLVTANNTYYANGFSSLYIPMHLAEEKSEEFYGALIRLKQKYERECVRREENGREIRSKLEYWDNLDIESFIYDDEGINPPTYEEFVRSLKNEFLNEQEEQDIDFHEKYRYQEYRCFANRDFFKEEEVDINFRDIVLSESISKYFTKIQQVEELKITNIQFDFTRVEPKKRIAIINDNGEVNIRESNYGQNIFSIDENNLCVLPANETYGEGLFFQFNASIINQWIDDNSTLLNERYSRFTEREINFDAQGASFMQKIKNNGIKHFLIHSFSHMMMRELEFSCGYPTASLKERLYISQDNDRPMSGVLIYTAEGSEGSMGGLVSQGEPDKILEIIKKGLIRSINCSSDPLCWESEGQGIFDLNLSACFSCSLVSETACEELNLGLDRRVLVDEQFGFFKNLLK